MILDRAGEHRPSEPEVLVEVAGSLMTITINRPERRNAVNRSVSDQIAAAIDHFELADELLVCIVTGAGGTFCSGMDMKDTSGPRASVPGRGFAGLTERPPTKPLIAAVEGWALAGGCELALAADLVVAASDAKFGLPEVKRGLVAAAGGLLRLPKSVPFQLAMLMSLTGEPVSAEVLFQHGLIASLSPPGEALNQARELAGRIAENSPLAVRVTKQILTTAVAYTDREAYTSHREVAAIVRSSDSAREGVQAFNEKRAANWDDA